MPPPHMDAGVGHSFGLDFDGMQVAGITDVRLTMETDVIELKENGPDGTVVVRKLPGRPKAPDITLTRGLTGDRAFDDWVAAVRAGHATRNGVISVADLAGAVLKRYRVFGAWPTTLQVGSSSAGESSVLVETLVLTCERLDVE
jgi:phage tail-like protein